MHRNEIVRESILIQCYGVRPGPRDAEHMARTARREGELVDALPDEFAREADYLVGRGFLEERPDALSKAHKRWAITAAGIDHLEGEGLV
jgi:hypothetical protein